MGFVYDFDLILFGCFTLNTCLPFLIVGFVFLFAFLVV